MAVDTDTKTITQNGTAITLVGVFSTDDTDTSASATPLTFSSDINATVNGKTYTGLRIKYIAMSSYQQVATYVSGNGWYVWQQPQVSSDSVPIFGIQTGHAGARDFCETSVHGAYNERTGSLHNINLQYRATEGSATANIDRVSLFIAAELV